MFTLRRVCGGRVAAKASRVAAAVAFAAIWLCGPSTSNAFAQSGWVLQYTGQLMPEGVRPPGVAPCAGAYCPFWEEFDRNTSTARIVVAGGQLYQLHNGGSIYRQPPTPCNWQCPGWWFIDYDPTTKAIFSDSDSLYKLVQDGRLLRWTGSSWIEIPVPIYGGPVVTVAFGGGTTVIVQETVLSIRRERTWEFNIINVGPFPVTVDSGGVVYTLTTNLGIDRYLEERPSNDYPGWRLRNYPIYHPHGNPVAIAAGGPWRLYTLQSDGSIWANTAAGWAKLDNNPATTRIVTAQAATGGDELYQLHNNGSLWRYTGTVCNGESCPGWELLLGGGVGRIAVDGQRVDALTQTQPLVRPAPISMYGRALLQHVCPECL